jgi:hypothetical protein
MSKGQKRGNREVRKPKQVKALQPDDNTFAGQVKLAAYNNAPRRKGRGWPDASYPRAESSLPPGSCR